MVYRLSLRTHNTGVVSSIPPCVTMFTSIKDSKPSVFGFCCARNRGCNAIGIFTYKNTIAEEGNGRPPDNVHFHKNLRALSLVSAALEIEYVTSLVRKATGNHLIKSTYLEKAQSPVSGFCCARHRVLQLAHLHVFEFIF